MDPQTFLHFALRTAAPFPSWSQYHSTPQPKISSSFLIENILGLNRNNFQPQITSNGCQILTSIKSDGKEMKSLKRARPVDDLKGENFSPSKSKRIRTIFTPDQLEQLEEEFAKCQYVVGAEREELARLLSLSSNQVKVWFQNRRIKYRKQQQEMTQTLLVKISDE
jgi:hypothetical protein